MFKEGRHCLRDAEQRKRINKTFDDQESEMNARALKAHDGSCESPLDCRRDTCLKWLPDRIVSYEYIVTRTMRLKEANNARIEKRKRTASLRGGLL